MSETLGILILSYGSPERAEDVEPYYTHILGGRKPRPELLQELQERYAAIPHRPSLARLTESLARKVEAELQKVVSRPLRTYVGMKHWHPFIADTVARMGADGIARAVAIVLSPQYSTVHTGSYFDAVQKANQKLPRPIDFTFVPTWHLHPRFQEALARRVQAALDRFPPEERPSVPVIFTAHSLPASVLDQGDPYPERLRECAEVVARRLGLQRFEVCYQSAGRTPVPWLGPDAGEVIARLRQEGYRSCVICPQGFVADHLEVLYDIDIDYAQQARELGMRLERTPSLNDDDDFAEAVAAVIADHLAEVGLR
ncbi:MAG: ferrochelatase [Firmicutes bacterium]|nr:ferrochelatase [Bacillota bacterium]